MNVQHPMQPIVFDETGVARFKRNLILDWLFKTGRIDLNEIVKDTHRWLHTIADLEQLYQLLGYSVAGYCDLNLVSQSSKDAAIAEAEKRRTRERRSHREDGRARLRRAGVLPDPGLLPSSGVPRQPEEEVKLKKYIVTVSFRTECTVTASCKTKAAKMAVRELVPKATDFNIVDHDFTNLSDVVSLCPSVNVVEVL